ncbi:MAG: chromosome segregation protein SMC [Deltaproteobacteria bacterium]|jgi:chromosome segregation protein|nr:chromosome segregation protein SMC [Deltaproteobacteria bacterium]
MRIKSLEICGFKSFAERTKLTFGDGITGVVGPNGCGKSNIIDSIRWAMGEMSAKHLRGRAMQDVIFAGSDSRGPLGMAEVTLTFHNDGNVPLDYMEYSEIGITRRLHRDGKTEYLINKVPCRLRDITDLFLGTGVGTRAYSIIEQGRIGFIVNSRPEDRRSLIEEVAGITKFKARKKAAERRMKSTEQNLARVNDIIAELERQLASLKRQAQKAQRYKRLREEQRGLDLHRASHRVYGLIDEQQQCREKLNELNQEVGDASRSIESDEGFLEADKLKMIEVERDIQARQAVSSDADTKVVSMRRDIEHWSEQLEESRNRIMVARTHQRDTNLRLEASSGERVTLVEQLSGLENSTDGDQDRLESLTARVEGLQERLASSDRETESLRAQAVELVHQAAQQRARMSGLEKQKVDTQRLTENLLVEENELSQLCADARIQHDELVQRDEVLTGQLGEWKESLNKSQGLFKDVSGRVGALMTELNALNGRLTKRSSRLQSLEEIARSLEGYSEGVKALMGGGEKSAVDGIKALVTDVLSVPEEYETAVEATLGDRLQYLVVEDLDVAQNAVEWLKAGESGRGGFIPLETKHAASSLQLQGTGVIGTALDLVAYDPAFSDIARSLLSDVVFVENMDAARANLAGLQASGHSAARLVTLSGEIVEASGVVVGGRAEGGGLLASKREIRELQDEVVKIEVELSDTAQKQETLEQERLQLEIDIQQLDKEVRSAEIEKIEVTKDRQIATAELRRLSERSEVLQYELEARRDEATNIAQELIEAKSVAEQAEEGQREAEEKVNQVVSQRSGLAEELEIHSEDLTALKINIASRDERLSALKSAIERLSMNHSEQKERLDQDQQTIAEGEALIAELSERLDIGREDIGELVERAQNLRDGVAQARQKYEEKRLKLTAVEQALRDRRRSSTTLQSSLNDERMRLQRLEMEQQRLCDQILERHDVMLMQVAPEYKGQPAPGAEVEERIEEIERLIKNMGSINLTAIDEHDEVEERHTFLVGQRDDLLEALSSLRKAINQINRTSRVRFKEAFEAVNEMFIKVFPRLFRGGRAALRLCDSDDLLECGVDIIAQPPGKKLQNVGLLSGGEKALTATALVFSIFLIKPTPFCVMDEVDAPLDDANVGRFNEMLREISKVSQFIVITHNKQTMSHLDRLYGITMEEPGMSKIVSVDLETSPRDRAA